MAAQPVVAARLPSARGPRNLDRIIITTIAVLLLASIGLLVVPADRFNVVAPSLDLVEGTVTTLATLAVAVLASLRFRTGREPVSLSQAAAFSVLAIINGTALALMVSGQSAGAGSSLAAAGQAPGYVATFARLLAAGLLVGGAAASLRRIQLRGRAMFLIGAAVALVGAMALAEVGAWALPTISDVRGQVIALGSSNDGALPTGTPASAGALLQLPAAALFIVAAGLSRRLYRRDRAIADAYMAVGLVFAAFAQLHYAFYPGIYWGPLTGSDILRVAFDVVLILGIEAEIRGRVGSLIRANERLQVLRDTEADRAALEERARLSRELHDGLAQNLWLAKLHVARLGAVTGIGPEAEALCHELARVVDAGLAEARQAVMATHAAGEGSFSELMNEYVDDFADGFGLRVEFQCAADLPRLEPRTEAELLRIAQEALNNVRHHADATVVRVRAESSDGGIRLGIVDNGRGFDTTMVGRSKFGLASMRERATLIGGRLSVDSSPHDGTRVWVEVPISAEPALAGGQS